MCIAGGCVSQVRRGRQGCLAGGQLASMHKVAGWVR